MQLQEIDSFAVTILMDNITDRFLSSSPPHTIRPPMIMNERFLLAPIAEHGFSALLQIPRENNSKDENRKNNNNTFLFDTGVSENGVIYNADIFGVDLKNVETIILSHGHLDHFTGLVNVLKRISEPTKVICHPDAFLKRWIVFPDGNRAKMPFLDEKKLEEVGALISKTKDASFLPNNDDDHESPSLLITGQIPRNTSFEKGFPIQFVEKEEENNNRNVDNKKKNNKNYKLLPDPLVNDDQAIIVNIKEKGLVIVTGCGHAGIINTINYAKSLTGVDKIYAVVGGFHLTGSIYEDIIEPTTTELQKADPKYLVPCHCTGWKATNRIIEIMPEKFIQTSVGTTFHF
jgi:7,8-dihydropterin-6-yl-methyl-4-(beta-D-ribofuranosyl)aminobenzene 5'-phosphate synthase